MFDFIELKTIYLILHLVGLALGAGGAFVSDAIFMTSMKDKKISRDEMTIISVGGNLVWFGLLLLTISGLLLMSLNWTGYIMSTKFIAKMIIVLIIAINGVVIHHAYLPKMRELVEVDLRGNEMFRKISKFLYVSGALSVVSWISALTLGAFKKIPLSVLDILKIYGVIVVGAMLVSLIVRRSFLRSK